MENTQRSNITDSSPRIFEHVKTDLSYGDLSCETLPSGRTYTTPEGKRYPSITTILGHRGKAGIMEWRKRVGEEEANRIGRQACVRGTKIHTLAERYLNNQNPDTSSEMPHVRAMFTGIRGVIDKSVGKIYFQETPLYSDHLKTAGRVDLCGEFNGKTSIIDFKTSKRIKTQEDITDYFLQAAAYCIMVEERTGLCVPQIVIIMGVDSYEKTPLVFIEKRDAWTKHLIERIHEYDQDKIFGR